MLARTIPAFVLVALLAPAVAVAADEGAADVVVTVLPEGASHSEGAGWLSDLSSDAGERHSWRIALPDEYGVVELRVAPEAFDVDRARQLVPLLHIDADEPVCKDPRTRGACDYPLFERVPRAAVWDVDAPARIANHTTEDGWNVVRVGIPGPVNATLVLERDVTPPKLAPRERENLTDGEFYQETTTDELAIVDLQVRKVGAKEWVQNPTPAYHVLQKFPIQGLDGDTEYEQRFVVMDWAGNSFTSDLLTFRTPAAPVGPPIGVLPLSPPPDTTVAEGSPIAVSARIETNGSEVRREDVRVYFDLAERTEGWTFQDGVVEFRPPEPVAPGVHVVRVEVTSDDGGAGQARWTFTVASETRADVPAVPLLALVGAVAALALARVRRA